MGKNKLQKFADMSRYPNVFQCTFADWQDASQGSADQACRDMRGRWNELFFKNDCPIVLELGCGKGEYALGLAKRFPECNFIGVDIKGARMWSGAKEALAEGLTNVAFLRTNIELINRFFAPGEVSEIWITFPDPQMKKATKRLTSSRFMQLYSEILSENGQIHLKTDSPFLYTYTNAMIDANQLPIIQKIDDVYARHHVNRAIASGDTPPPEEDILSIHTYYEQQWLDRGLTIKYINFMLTSKPNYVEPDIEIEPDNYRSFNRSRRGIAGQASKDGGYNRSGKDLARHFSTAACTAVLIFSAFLFLRSSKAPEPTGEDLKEFATPVSSFPLPSEVEFANQKISLERLDMRERFDRELNTQAYLHASTMLIIKRANRYFPIIEPILKANNIPDDFKYLCVIESNLDTRALSPAKAAGLWQFMEGTAKNYGLEIRAGVDERYHIEKATEAACYYFRAAYQKYNNWMDVAASYNAGTGRISSEMNKQEAESAFDLLLVSETSRYMFRILAAKELLNHPKRYGYLLKKENLYPQVAVDYVEVSTDVPDWTTFAKEHGISYATLKEYNVWLRDTKLEQPKKSPKTYRIAIPKKEDLQFDAKKLKVHDNAWVTV
ncbi:hypothetical protein AGMMS49525_03140 [Bacteroidia bacterium]|nr:hypothetical protein AGMMS49525_03140 [Bacteroidia bacterium]